MICTKCKIDKEVRGLLCKRCNSMLGYFENDLELVNKAIEYLNTEIN